MVEFGNNLDVDEEFDVLHSILDFPMECLEEDEDAEGWDISNPECLGPIPSNVLMGPPMSDEKFNFRHPDVSPQPVAPIAGVSELKQLPKRVDDSDLHILPLRKISEVQESPSFRTQSPVSVLESSGSGSKEKSLSIISDNFIPVRSRSKRARYAGVNPWLLAAHGLSTSKPAPNARRSRESIGLLKSSHSFDVADPAHLQNTSKKCSHCQSTKTPQWRWGPLGKNTLCNACGVRYRSGRLFPEYRPAASPTFARSQHSNSHRKVIAMRTAKTKLAPLSPKTEAKIEELPIALQMEAKFLEPPSAQLEVQIVGAPEGKQLTDASSSHVHLQITGTPTRKQLAKHVDTSGSLISQQIAPMQKKLADYDDTCSSQNKDASVQESGAFNAENHVSLVESRGPCLRERWLSFLSSRSNHIQPAGENLSLLASHPPSTCRKTSYASEGKESGRESFHLPAPKNASVGPASIQNASKHEHARMKKCAHCQSTKTPQWRQGPLGPRTLCNACGVRYRSGRLVPEYRPAASPTFVASKHSNLHSEILQMIKAEHAIKTKVTTNIPSPQPESVS